MRYRRGLVVCLLHWRRIDRQGRSWRSRLILNRCYRFRLWSFSHLFFLDCLRPLLLNIYRGLRGFIISEICNNSWAWLSYLLLCGLNWLLLLQELLVLQVVSSLALILIPSLLILIILTDGVLIFRRSFLLWHNSFDFEWFFWSFYGESVLGDKLLMSPVNSLTNKSKLSV